MLRIMQAPAFYQDDFPNVEFHSGIQFPYRRFKCKIRHSFQKRVSDKYERNVNRYVAQ